MENFFDKFDPPKDGEAEVPMGDPGPEPQLAVPDMPAVPEGGNPFDAIEAAQPPAPEPLSYDEFQVQLVQKLNEGKTENVAWHQTIGTDAHPVFDASHGVVYYAMGEYTNDASGIEHTPATVSTQQSIYSIGGAKLQHVQKGINIVRMADGTVRKVLVK